MPYYVYQIRTNNRDNHLYNSFDNYAEADKLEKDMKAGNYLGDDYFVTMFFAENDREAEIKANDLRPHPKLL